MTVPTEPIQVLLRVVVNSLTGTTSIQSLADSVMESATSKGLAHMKRPTVLTAIRRCIVNRPGSHFQKRGGNTFNPEVDLLWEIEYKVLVKVDPKKHLSLAPTGSEATHAPRKRGKALPPEAPGQLTLMMIAAEQGLSLDSLPSPPFLDPTANDNQQVHIVSKKGLRSEGNVDGNATAKNPGQHSLQWGDAVRTSVGLPTRKLVDALAYHTGPLQFAVEPPSGLQSDEWVVEALLVDEGGRLVIVTCLPNQQEAAVKAVASTLLWGMRNLPAYPDVLMYAVAQDKGSCDAVMSVWNGNERIRFFCFETTAHPVGPGFTKLSGDR